MTFNVLSLFDGIAGALQVFKELGIKVDNYFASEIDKYAMKIAKKNHPEIIYLGDVRNIKGSDLPKIDLLIAGSPCQGFSFAGKQLNFADNYKITMLKILLFIRHVDFKKLFLRSLICY